MSNRRQKRTQVFVWYTYDVAQARIRDLVLNFNGTPGPMGQSVCVEAPGEAGQGK